MQQTHAISEKLCSFGHVAERTQDYVLDQAADDAFHQKLRRVTVRILSQSSGGDTQGDYALAFLSHGIFQEGISHEMRKL